MKLHGHLYECGATIDGHKVTEAVISRQRIVIDWIENGLAFHMVARSDDGGITYKGTFGWPHLDAGNQMTLKLYKCADKSCLLHGNWYMSEGGEEGACSIVLSPVD